MHPLPSFQAALNFSYSLLRERVELVTYFAQARASLADDGIFIIDCHGGASAVRSDTHKRRHVQLDVLGQFDYNCTSGVRRAGIQSPQNLSVKCLFIFKMDRASHRHFNTGFDAGAWPSSQTFYVALNSLKFTLIGQTLIRMAS